MTIMSLDLDKLVELFNSLEFNKHLTLHLLYAMGFTYSLLGIVDGIYILSSAYSTPFAEMYAVNI